MLYFAYGANMDRAIMRRHAPAAAPLGAAALADHRFVITRDGYASVEPKHGATVHGVLWRLTPRDRAGLDAWECVAAGLYRTVIMPVHAAGRRPALIYLARPTSPGRPKAGYMELVIAAARAWELPDDYMPSLQRWLPKQPGAAGPRKLGVSAFKDS